MKKKLFRLEKDSNLKKGTKEENNAWDIYLTLLMALCAIEHSIEIYLINSGF